MASVRSDTLYELKDGGFRAERRQLCAGCGNNVQWMWVVYARPVGSSDTYSLFHIGCVNEAPPVMEPEVPEFNALGDWDFSPWLGAQAGLQEYGRILGNPGMIPDAVAIEMMTVKEVAQHVRTHILCTLAELHEALDETPWKPWADDAQGINEVLFAGEMIDALHFIANALLIGAPTINGKMLAQMYRDKSMKNAKRWRDGYHGRADKCPGCGRDKDELPPDHHIFTGVDDSYTSCNYRSG